MAVACVLRVLVLVMGRASALGFGIGLERVESCADDLHSGVGEAAGGLARELLAAAILGLASCEGGHGVTFFSGTSTEL
ncbi:hypothetical protein JKP88DRAFT_216608 [Tribonema minus]|uniref:Secreted protein n=1 Tax=Tribonema minus TaxID=303371 RepID=A0A835YL88_9STRA|nr:hypothetical protein JKP88DRAFT_216608 [Tribonema minus]